MNLDFLIAFQGGAWSIIQAELCVWKSDGFSNTIHLMTHMKTLISALPGATLSLIDLLGTGLVSETHGPYFYLCVN